MTAYEEGYALGVYKRESDENLDLRSFFAQAARAGTFAEFKRGFEDGFYNREQS